MKKILLFLLFSFSLSVFGQEEYYERIWGEDTEYSELTDMIETPDGGYAILGLQNKGTQLEEVYLVKTDANGTEEWSQTYGQTNLQDEGGKLFLTPNNNLIIVGLTSSLLVGSHQFFLRKVDLTDGAELWYMPIDEEIEPVNTNYMTFDRIRCELNHDGSLINITYYGHLYKYDFEGEKVDEIVFANNVNNPNYLEKPEGGYLRILSTYKDTLYAFAYDENGSIDDTLSIFLDWTDGESDLISGSVYAQFDNNDNLIVGYRSSQESFLGSYNETYEKNWHIENPLSSSLNLTSFRSYIDLKITNNNQIFFIYHGTDNEFIEILNYHRINQDGTSSSAHTYEIGPLFRELKHIRCNIDGSLSLLSKTAGTDVTKTKGSLLKIEGENIIWEKEYGIDQHRISNLGSKILKMEDDKFLIANHHVSNGELLIQLLLQTVDRGGNILHTESFDEPYFDIAEAGDGNFLTINFDFDFETYDITQRLVKLDQDYTVLWETPIPDQIQLENLIQEEDGHLYITHVENPNSENLHIAFVKIGTNGSIIDSTVVATDFPNGFVRGNSYVKDNGHYLFTVGNSENNWELTFVEFSANFSFVSSFVYEGDNIASFPNKIFEGTNGTINAGGQIFPYTGQSTYLWLAQFDENGSIVKERTDTLLGFAQYRRNLPLEDGVIVYGQTGNYQVSNGNAVFLTKINQDLETEWIQYFRDDLTRILNINDIIKDGENFAITGSILENNTTKLYYAHTDGSITGINDLPFQNATIQLFPNPTQDKINIVFENEQVVKGNITISNTMGQTIKTIKAPIFPNATLEIPVRDLADGIYIVNIQNGNEVIAKQFVVKR